MKYIIELSDDEMEKVKNSHKALFIDVYRMMANIIKNGIAFEEDGEDTISRQAVIDCFKQWQPYMATRLHDFEKELFKLPTVKPTRKCDDVLDKIIAEIEEYKSRQLTFAIGVDDLEKGKQIAIEYVLAIIDKYRKESEVDNG